MGVYKKGNEYWIDYYCKKRRRHREKVGTDKRQAEKALGKRLGQIAEDKFFEARVINKRFSTFAKEALEWYQVNRPKSAQAMAYKVELFNGHFGHHSMDEITRTDVEAFIEKRKSELMEQRRGGEGKPDADHFATINRDIAYLKRIFNLAIDRNHCKTNPCKGIGKEKERERVRFLRDEDNEEARLLEACSSRMRNIVLFALHTGFRRGEIVSLEWSSVDLNRGFIRVEASKAKNSTSRTVPVNAVVREVLEELKGERKRPQGFVFLNAAGKPYQDYAVSQQFILAAKRAGLEDFRFHDLRHTFASRLAMRGVELLDLARLLGHKTIQMVMRYSHLTDHRLQSHVDLLTQPLPASKMQPMDTIWSPRPFLASNSTLRDSRKPLN